LKTILIVDDNKDTLTAMGKMATHLGYRALTSQDGWSALSIINKGNSVDLVITDYQMPGMNGLELAGMLKQRDPPLPVILVSGCPKTELYLKALTIGIDDFREKPMGPYQFKRVVEDLIGI
jgi:two-component system cell cycle sensor histidine kinase/response regulator CckA